MISFKYNKKIDTQCWQRIIKAKKLFGHTFPTKFNISRAQITTAREMSNHFQEVWERCDKEIFNGIKTIYGYSCPKKLFVFVNTSPYSMDGYPSKYISISMTAKKTRRIISTIGHELSHFVFRQHFTQFCYKLGCTKDEIEEIKEILTVINNIKIPGVLDKGWPVHSSLRKWVKRQWLYNHNLKLIIKDLHKFLKK